MSLWQWVHAREKFQQAANLMDAEQRMKKSMWGQFWSAHQRFFKYLCIASKVRRVVQLAREEVQNGKVSRNRRLDHWVSTRAGIDENLHRDKSIYLDYFDSSIQLVSEFQHITWRHDHFLNYQTEERCHLCIFRTACV